MREIHQLPYMMRKMLVDAAIFKFPVSFLVGAAQYFFPTLGLKNSAIIAFCFILLDMITGVVAAFTTDKQISSAKLGRTLVKMLGYGSVVMVTVGVSKGIPGIDGLGEAATATVLTIVILTEGLSVLENVRCMGVKMPDFLEKILRDRLNDISTPKITPAPAEPQ